MVKPLWSGKKFNVYNVSLEEMVYFPGRGFGNQLDYPVSDNPLAWKHFSSIWNTSQLNDSEKYQWTSTLKEILSYTFSNDQYFK